MNTRQITTQLPPLSLHPRGAIARRRTRMRLSRASAAETGGTMVEGAITLTLLLMAIFGIMDCSRALYCDHYVRYTAEEAARYAMVRGSTWKNATCTTTATESCTATGANVLAWVNSITPPGIDTSNNLTVTTTWTGKTPSGLSCTSTSATNSPGCVVRVQIGYNFNFVLPFLPANGILLQSSSSVAISQ